MSVTVTAATVSRRLDTEVIPRLERIDARLDQLNLNGHLEALVRLANVSSALVELAQHQAPLVDLADRRSEEEKLEDARALLRGHRWQLAAQRFRVPLTVLRYVTPFALGALAWHSVVRLPF